MSPGTGMTLCLSSEVHRLIITRPPPVYPIGAINSQFNFIQHTLSPPSVPAHSDLEEQNLNITIPLSHKGGLDSNTRLPVCVFVHGGRFAVGSSWYPHYNPAAVVKLSAELGNPMIGITIKCVILTSVTACAERFQLSTRCP
jgi:hypothetical protein